MRVEWKFFFGGGGGDGFDGNIEHFFGSRARNDN